MILLPKKQFVNKEPVGLYNSLTKNVTKETQKCEQNVNNFVNKLTVYNCFNILISYRILYQRAYCALNEM